MKALVTGAAGYIGRILCRMLNQEGWDVVANDVIYHDSWRGNVVNWWIGSYSDPELYYNDSYDVIFHLGANSLLGPSVKDPLTYFDNNVSKMTKMLQLDTTQTPIIFASSAATYGDPGKDIMLREEHAGNPINPYGWSKWLGEIVLEQACLAYGRKAYAMRFFNVAGSYEDLGQDLDQPHILTKMSVARLTNQTFYINGNKYNTEDGFCVRDYIHVADVCDALITAACDLIVQPEYSFTEYNVCSGTKISNGELAEIFANKFNLKIGINDSRPGDPGYLYGDNTNMRNELGWKPTMDIHNIIESHYEYTRKSMNAN